MKKSDIKQLRFTLIELSRELEAISNSRELNQSVDEMLREAQSKITDVCEQLEAESKTSQWKTTVMWILRIVAALRAMDICRWFIGTEFRWNICRCP